MNIEIGKTYKCRYDDEDGSCFDTLIVKKLRFKRFVGLCRSQHLLTGNVTVVAKVLKEKNILYPTKVKLEWFNVNGSIGE